MKTILVTGAAGFIGFHLVRMLCELDYNVIGVDNMNDYYDVKLKFDRLHILQKDEEHFKFYQFDIREKDDMRSLFNLYNFDYVVNLAAQAGVRYSKENPSTYLENNIVGFGNVIELCKEHNCKLMYASSSSVYGGITMVPFSEDAETDTPLSVYAMTKKADELMAYSYSKMYDMTCIGLRFFTVYGEWGRPDMAYMSFTKKILNEETIEVYNNGKLKRDFTYVGDVVDGIVKLLESNISGYNIYNIGKGHPDGVMDLVKKLELWLHKEAKIEYKPMQSGDMYVTYANVHKLEAAVGYVPKVYLNEGIGKFVEWYKKYYDINN